MEIVIPKRVSLKKVFLVTLSIVLSIGSYAASTSWIGATSTAWGNAANWTNGVPTSTLDVVIGDASFTGSFQPKLSTATSFAQSLTIGNATKVSVLTVANTNYSLVVAGNILIGANGTILQSAKSTITVTGNWTNNGVISHTNTGANITFSGVVESINGSNNTFANVTISNSPNTVTLNCNITVTQTLSVSAILNPNGNLITISSATATLGLRVNSTGRIIVTTALYSSNYSRSPAYMHANGVVEYAGAGAQTISNAFSYAKLVMSSNTIKTLVGNTTVTNSIAITAGTFDLGSFTANRSTAGGSFAASNGTFVKIGGTGTFPTNYNSVPLSPTSTVEYYGTNQAVAAKTYGHLILSNATSSAITKTMPGTAFTVVGNFTSVNYSSGTIAYTAAQNITIKGLTTIGASTTFNGGSYTHTFSGNWINNGTYTGATSTVSMNTPNTTITGTGVFDMYSLTVSKTGITAAAAINLSFSGNLSTTGTGTFTHTCGGGGIVTMTGTSKAISGAGIMLNELVIAGTITSTSTFTLCGNITVNSAKSFVCANASNITMTGTSKVISNSGTLTFYKLTIPLGASITTSSSFTMLSNLGVSGSLSASAGAVTFGGTSTLSGAPNLFDVTITTSKTLTLSNFAVLGISNTFTKSGTLNVTTSVPNTVDYNGSGNQSVVAATYNKLKLSTGGTKTSAGTITTNASITISSGVTFDGAATTISVKTDWVNNGTYIANTSTVAFTGAANSYLTGATTFNVVTVNKSTAANVLYLNPSSSIIAATVNMTSGDLLTNANSVTITTTRTGNGYIYGTIIRSHTFTTAVAYAFEGPYNTITFTAVSGVTSITVVATKAAVADFPTGTAINREYDISVGGATPVYVATLQLHYLDTDLNGNNEANMNLWKIVAGTWTSQGKTTNSTVNNWVNLTGLTSLPLRWTCAEPAGIVQWTGAVSSNWATAGNWSIVTGTPAMPPASNDVVQIGSYNYTNAPNISSTVSIRSLIFYSTKASTLSMLSGGDLSIAANIAGNWSGNATHTINTNDQSISIGGSMILSDGTAGHNINLNVNAGTVDVGDAFTQSGASNVTFTSAGNLKIGADYTKSGSGVFTAATSTVTYQGAALQTMANVAYYNLTVNKTSGTTQFLNSITISNDLTLSVAGQLDLLYNVTVGRHVTISSGTTINADAALFSVAGDWNNLGTFNQGAGKVLFTGTANQNCSATPFNNIEINKTAGTVTLTGNCVVNDSLTVINGILDLTTYTMERTAIGGVITMANSSKISASGASNFPENYTTNNLASTSTVEYYGSIAQDVKVVNYGNLTLTNGSPTTKKLVSNITVNGDLTINSGATLDGNGSIIELYGNWVGNGTFTYANSTVNCRGTSKTISGTNTFNDILIFGTYATVTGTTTSVFGDLIINGVFTQASDNAYLYGDFFNNGNLTTLGITTFMGQQAQTIANNGTLTAGFSSIINYNGTVSPLIFSTVAPNYATVNINNTGGIYPILPWTVYIAMNVGAGATFDGNGLTHNIYGNVTNSGIITNVGSFVFSTPLGARTLSLGNFTCGSSATFAGSQLITLAGSGNQEFNNITITNTHASGITQVTDWEIAGDLIINAGSTFHVGSATDSIAGDINVNGFFDGGTSTIIMTGDAQIGGLGTLTFNHITFDGLDSLTSNIYVTGDFIDDGTFNANGYAVEFTGSAVSTISGATTPVPFENIIISKSTSSTNLATNILVNRDLTINTGASLIPSTNTITILGDWTNNGVFCDSIIPQSLVQFNGTAIQAVNGLAVTNFGNVTINNSGGVNLASNQTIHGSLLLQSGQLASTGYLTLNLNQGNISGAGSGSISGNITTRKSVTNTKGTHYISSPLTGKTVADWNDDEAFTGSNYFYYDETLTASVNAGWTKLTTVGAPLIEMKGYSLYFKAPRTVDMTGTYDHTHVPTNASLTLTRSGNLGIDGWNLIGNPYPSDIDWLAASGWTKTNLYNAIYFWNPLTKTYVSYINGVGVNGGTQYIPSMQAFWVRLDTTGTGNKTGTLGMTNAVRVTTDISTAAGTPSLWRVANLDGIIKMRVQNASNTTLSDETAIRISDDATDGFDGNMDAYKMNNFSTVPTLSSEYMGNSYSINSIPALTKNTVVPIKMSTKAYGDYTLSITQFDNIGADVSVILIDTLTHTKQDLKMNPSLIFNVSIADTITRFYLNITNAPMSTTPIKTESIVLTDIYSYKHTIYVHTNIDEPKGSMTLVNSTGQIVLTDENCILENHEYTKDIKDIPAGIYIVQFKIGNNLYTQKVLLD